MSTKVRITMLRNSRAVRVARLENGVGHCSAVGNFHFRVHSARVRSWEKIRCKNSVAEETLFGAMADKSDSSCG